MTHSFNSNSQQEQDSIGKRMVIGAGIGLLLISVFVIPAEANPAWGKFWMIRPLLVTPLAGAIGGLCSYFIVNFRGLAGVNKNIVTIISLVVLIAGLFLGLILGMDGTLWD